MLEKFDLFAAAPGATQRLREIILHLAVNGQLLPCDYNWPSFKLKDMTNKIGSGATPKGGRQAYHSTGIPLIRSMNVYFEGFRYEGLAYLNKQQAGELSNVVVQEHDVLLNITGASIGRVATIPATMVGARVNQHVAIIRSKPELNHRFLAIYLASPKTQSIINDIEVGATRQALTKALIEELLVSIPLLADQQRIVDKVDELMAVCDRLEAQQRERDIRHATLTRAALARFAAAPTPDNLQYLFHPAYDISPADLRTTILRLASLGLLCSPNNCLEWKSQTLSDITLKITDGAHQTPKYVADGVPFVSIKDFSAGCLDFTKTRKITAAEHRMLYNRCDPRRGDILLGRIGTIGKPTVVNVDFEFSLFVSVALIRPNPNLVTSEFLKMSLETPGIKRQFEAIKVGGATHTNKLNLGDLRNVEISLPDLAEQRRIVAKVDHLMSLVDRYESQLAAARDTATGLLDALVAELTGTVRRASASTAKRHPDPAEERPASDITPTPRPAPSASPTSVGRTSIAAARSSGDSDALLALLRARGSCSSSEAQAATGLDPATLRGLFKALIDQGLVRTEGQRRGMRYLPTAKAAHAQ